MYHICQTLSGFCAVSGEGLLYRPLSVGIFADERDHVRTLGRGLVVERPVKIRVHPIIAVAMRYIFAACGLQPCLPRMDKPLILLMADYLDLFLPGRI